MFSDTKTLVKDLKKLYQGSSVSYKRNYFKTLNFTEAHILLFSILYNFKSKIIPTPIPRTDNENKDSWDIILGRYLYFILKDDPNFKEYFLSLPFDWQNILYMINKKNILLSLGEKVFFKYIDDIYTKDKVISLVTLPLILEDNAFIIQNIKRDYSIQIEFPLNVYKVSKLYIIKKVKFIIVNGNKIFSNCKYQHLKSKIKKKYGNGFYGVLFLESRIQGFKYKRNFIPLFYGNPDDILSLYKGKSFNIENIQIEKGLKLTITLHNEKELTEFLKNNYKSSFLYLSKQGIHQINVQKEYIKLKCLDYILDDDFEPIGVIVEYKGKSYNLRFNIQNTELYEGIKNRYVKCLTVKIGDELMELKYNSVVPVWHTKYAQCKYCNSVKFAHFKSGVCNKCANKFIKNILIGNLDSYKSDGDDFNITLKVNNSYFEVKREYSKISYKCIKGQGSLSFG